MSTSCARLRKRDPHPAHSELMSTAPRRTGEELGVGAGHHAFERLASARTQDFAVGGETYYGFDTCRIVTATTRQAHGPSSPCTRRAESQSLFRGYYRPRTDYRYLYRDCQ